jgi:dipeptidyl aminopeptidase/acylaminoacyl peptidase
MPTVSRPQPGRPARLVYARSFSDWNVWRVELSDPGAPALSPPVIAMSSTQLDLVGDLSPDGRQLAFMSNRSGDSVQIWLADPAGANAVQLTSTALGFAAAPRWSRDGQLVAFHSNLDGPGQFDIYVIPAAGGTPRRMTSHPANDLVPSFSRDGQWIYFSSMRTGDYQVWKVPTSGGEALQVTHSGGFKALEGYDGATLYYTETPGGTPTTLWRIPTLGGPPDKVLEGVLSAMFAVLERGIYYIDRPTEQTRLQFFDFATGRSTLVAHNLGDLGPLLTATPDGRTILYSRLDFSLDDLMLVENVR